MAFSYVLVTFLLLGLKYHGHQGREHGSSHDAGELAECSFTFVPQVRGREG